MDPHPGEKQKAGAGEGPGGAWGGTPTSAPLPVLGGGKWLLEVPRREAWQGLAGAAVRAVPCWGAKRGLCQEPTGSMSF